MVEYAKLTLVRLAAGLAAGEALAAGLAAALPLAGAEAGLDAAGAAVLPQALSSRAADIRREVLNR